jgi:hypothetical protein
MRNINGVDRFAVAMSPNGAYYEMRGWLNSGMSVILGSESVKDSKVNGVNKFDIMKRAVRILNQHWSPPPKKRKPRK